MKPHNAALSFIFAFLLSSCSPDTPPPESPSSEEAHPKVVEAPLPSDPQLPDEQKKFMSAVASFKARLSYPENPIQDARVVNNFCNLQKTKSFSHWIARLEEISAPGPLDENGEVGVKLTVDELRYRRTSENTPILEPARLICRPIKPPSPQSSPPASGRLRSPA
jgi:hypothetical protein